MKISARGGQTRDPHTTNLTTLVSLCVEYEKLSLFTLWNKHHVPGLNKEIHSEGLQLPNTRSALSDGKISIIHLISTCSAIWFERSF